MGTPEFSVASLDKLYKGGYEIAAVVTAADKPAGRGRKLKMSAVKQYALEKGLPVLQPMKLKNPEFLQALEDIKPDLMVVVAFRMLPKAVWGMPTKGTFNLHASLLPDYRGAAPINWVLINGEKQTGVTTFFIDTKMDTGNILLSSKVDIPFEWTAGDLHDALMEVGADLVLETVKGIDDGSLKASPQDHSLSINKAPKIFKEDCEINWNQPGVKVYNFIRGLSPYPTAWTSLNGGSVKVFKVRLGEGIPKDTVVGTIWRPNNKELAVATQDRWIHIDLLQLAGKKRMQTAAFLLGYKGELIKMGK